MTSCLIQGKNVKRQYQNFTKAETLNVKCPFTRPHDGFARAIFSDAVDVHLWGADHEVHVGEAGVPARGVELFIC